MWIDRRYEDAASLKAAAEIMLSELQRAARFLLPWVFTNSRPRTMIRPQSGSASVLSSREVGDSVDTYITELTRKRDDLKESTITVANRVTSIAASLADMADRQRIEQTYAQGATRIYSVKPSKPTAPRTPGRQWISFFPRKCGS